MHAYADGRAPGLARVQDLGVEAITFPASATSEDIAMLLADEKGARLIVAVGTHATLVEFLDKGRGGHGLDLPHPAAPGRQARRRQGREPALPQPDLHRGPRRARARRASSPSARPSPCPRPARSTSTCCSTNGTASCSGWRTSSRDRLPLSPGLADRRLPGGRARDRHRHHRAQRADPRRHQEPGQRAGEGQALAGGPHPAAADPARQPPTPSPRPSRPRWSTAPSPGASVLLVVADEDVAQPTPSTG